MTRLKHITLLIGIFLNLSTYSQRWTNNYLEGQDPYGDNLKVFYDHGYLLIGRYGPNWPSFNWLIKTDINGEMIWDKVLGIETSYLLFQDIDYNVDGDIYLVGSTYYYSTDNNADPLIIKINSCGEKQWCRVFKQNGYNFSKALVVTSDKGVVLVLKYMGTEPFLDDICLAKFDTNGTLLWRQCYNSSDTLVHGLEAYDIILSNDGGFLISGSCSYEYPYPPHYWSDKPYFLKIDSLGNFEWEIIIQKEEASIGGESFSSVLNPDSTFYYSSLNHNYHSAGDAAALLKMDLSGNVIGIYDLAPPNTYGKMMRAKFISDTTLMASAVWGSAGPPKAVIIDTLGNILNSTVLVNNNFMAHTEVTFDNKLLFMTNMEENNGNFNSYLFKLNQQLQSDTIYNQIFTYDSLCSYQIVSDTITQDDCEVIVSNKYLNLNSRATGLLFIYPNPAKDSFVVRVDHSGQKVQSIEITDLYGQTVKSIKWYQTESGIVVDTGSLDNGIYIVKALFINGNKVSGKVVISQ